eukprot:8208559-Alexandrium_andersonii.AAC.1
MAKSHSEESLAEGSESGWAAPVSETACREPLLPFGHSFALWPTSLHFQQRPVNGPPLPPPLAPPGDPGPPG